MNVTVSVENKMIVVLVKMICGILVSAIVSVISHVELMNT